MKEVLGSLPEVITAYKNYNLLVPTATDPSILLRILFCRRASSP